MTSDQRTAYRLFVHQRLQRQAASGYRLMVPSWYDINDSVIVVYDVAEMLKLQHADKTLVGHPSKDLPDTAWGTVRFPARKAARWVERGRLLKIRMKDQIKPVTGGDEILTLSIRYSEPAEWQAILTPDEWQWIISLCQVSEIYKEQHLASQQQQAITPEPPQKPERSKRRRLKAKERRRQLRREQTEGERW